MYIIVPSYQIFYLTQHKRCIHNVFTGHNNESIMHFIDFILDTFAYPNTVLPCLLNSTIQACLI